MTKKNKIPKPDRDAAIRVLKQSKIVKNWVSGQMRAFGVDPDSPEGKAFYERESEAAAERLIK